jgi:hypothetical protein
MVDGGVILNRINDASLTLVSGIDYQLAVSPFDGSRTLVFRDNPFNNPLVSVQNVMNGKLIVDQEAVLWLYGSEFDYSDIYQQFGYAVTGPVPVSSESYRRFVNAIYDGIIQGGTARNVADLFAAAADVPLARTDGEVVETIFSDENYQWVITHQNAYKLALAATPVVAVGDVLTFNQPICDAVQFFEFNTGTIPDNIQALAVGPGLLGAGYQQDLVFSNENTPLIVTTDPMGFTKVSFSLGGLTEDVTLFWDTVHANGLAAGQTLADLLDQRPLDARTTQPTALALPATINPLGFLLANLLRDNAFLAVVVTSSFGPNAVGLTRASIALRQILPPQTLCIVLATLEGNDPPVILDGPGDTMAPGYEESWASFNGNPTSDTVDPTDYVMESGRTRQMN